MEAQAGQPDASDEMIDNPSLEHIIFVLVASSPSFSLLPGRSIHPVSAAAPRYQCDQH